MVFKCGFWQVTAITNKQKKWVENSEDGAARIMIMMTHVCGYAE